MQKEGTGKNLSKRVGDTEPSTDGAGAIQPFEAKTAIGKSALSRKGLADYTANPVVGCKVGCRHCAIPFTPAIRTKGRNLDELGVAYGTDWGDYSFPRTNFVAALDQQLQRMEKAGRSTLVPGFEETPAGRGITMFSINHDPFQDQPTADIVVQAIAKLLDHDRRIRIHTRMLLYRHNLNLLAHPKVKVGASIPSFNEDRLRLTEPKAPSPTARLKTLTEARRQGVATFVTIAPTTPDMAEAEMRETLDRVLTAEPEVIFWEPYNPDPVSLANLAAAGVPWLEQVESKAAWVASVMDGWEKIEAAAKATGCLDRLHIWPDHALKGYVDQARLDEWWYRPTVEHWG